MVVPALTTFATEDARCRSQVPGETNHELEAEVELVARVALALLRPVMDLFVRLLRICTPVVVA